MCKCYYSRHADQGAAESWSFPDQTKSALLNKDGNVANCKIVLAISRWDVRTTGNFYQGQCQVIKEDQGNLRVLGIDIETDAASVKWRKNGRIHHESLQPRVLFCWWRRSYPIPAASRPKRPGVNLMTHLEDFSPSKGAVRQVLAKLLVSALPLINRCSTLHPVGWFSLRQFHSQSRPASTPYSLY